MSVSTEANPRLAALTAAGTSVWLDQIRRSLIENGELQRLIDEDSLRGVTANPAIFEKAILGSDDYDAEIRAMAREGLDPKAMYERIAVTDVQMAADVMRPVWEHNDHDDGFVSLEVDPDLAHDTDGTLEQVRAFWKRLDRPNVFIKIPGTEEGAPAIEQAIYEGINVNVTLLFAVAAYERVAEAYIRGLERRLDRGRGPGRGARCARRGRDRPRRRARQAPARRREGVRNLPRRAVGRHRGAARGRDHRAPADHPVGDPVRAGGADRRNRQAGDGGVGGQARLAQGRHPLGRARRAGDRRSAGLADDLRADARARRRAARL